MLKTIQLLLVVLVFISTGRVVAQRVDTSQTTANGTRMFSLSNGVVTQRVMIRDGKLSGDALLATREWLGRFHPAAYGVYTDGDFNLKMMWTGWSAPGRAINADVRVGYDKGDFRYQSYRFYSDGKQGKLLDLNFTGISAENSTQLKITYQLLPGKFYARRRISVRDTLRRSNWLDTYQARKGLVRASGKSRGDHAPGGRILKAGSFGQPCALDFPNGGVFFGVEYPAATTTVHPQKNQRGFWLSCSETIGRVVSSDWIPSQWVVEGLSPDNDVKLWFFKYLPDIRVAPVRPYALYNTWYDLRTPVTPHLASDHIMNERNILHIIDLFNQHMIKPYGIHLDAFVLDDGWDVHHSDWQLRRTTFPQGLKPISDALKPLGTTLGVWFGPTGGYSFRNDRIDWMRQHGYEVSGRGKNAMMCIAGTKYSALFTKRTTDMVRDAGVGYFKWDGIQFSCSDPSHGHPTGYYSRRAIMDSMIAKCEAVRRVNPDVYLNITSGTWLSPWWLRYANQIWMQGNDFGFADVPSVSQRDASMTYKDFVLYHDLRTRDEWFPVSNLMTHGIIKGRLNEIGGTDDPLSNFTNDAVFYFARGVTMYELYISPDMLNKGEWNTLSKSLKWAEGNFDVLRHTDMVGGDPTQGKPYGYVHFQGDKGILAVRNPSMGADSIRLKLDPGFGLDPGAGSLVLERVYPTRWISPVLYAAGATLSLPVSGYEAAVYELYPLDSATRPLLADVTFQRSPGSATDDDVQVLNAGSRVRILNPGKVASVTVDGHKADPEHLGLPASDSAMVLTSHKLHADGARLQADLSLATGDVQSRFIVMLHPDSAFQGAGFPKVRLQVDGKTVTATMQRQKGVWAVYSVMLGDKEAAGKHSFRLELETDAKVSHWTGRADAWISTQYHPQGRKVSITTRTPGQDALTLPGGYEPGALKKDVSLGGGRLRL